MVEKIISFELTGILISAGIMLVTGAVIVLLYWRVLKSKKARIISSIALILVLVAGIFITQSPIPKENDTSAIYFLPTQGLIHATPDEEISIQLFCYGDKENPLLAEGVKTTPIQTDNDNLVITESTIEPGITTKGMTIFTILLTAEVGSPGMQTFTKIFLMDESGKTKAFDIGEIEIETQEPNEGNAIEIRRHLGSAGLDGAYSFTINNGSNKPCIISDIDFGSLRPFIKEKIVAVNEMVVDATTVITLQPGDQLSISAKFNTDAGKDIYLISPKIRYHLQDEKTQYSYPLPYGLLGLPVSDDKTQEIYEKYFQI
jgi:hypothetical protein